jgi:hypothetical protein
MEIEENGLEPPLLGTAKESAGANTQNGTSRVLT